MNEKNCVIFVKKIPIWTVCLVRVETQFYYLCYNYKIRANDRFVLKTNYFTVRCDATERNRIKNRSLFCWRENLCSIWKPGNNYELTSAHDYILQDEKEVEKWFYNILMSP
jgi:hypothetical protein